MAHQKLEVTRVPVLDKEQEGMRMWSVMPEQKNAVPVLVSWLIRQRTPQCEVCTGAKGFKLATCVHAKAVRVREAQDAAQAPALSPLALKTLQRLLTGPIQKSTLNPGLVAKLLRERLIVIDKRGFGGRMLDYVQLSDSGRGLVTAKE